MRESPMSAGTRLRHTGQSAKYRPCCLLYCTNRLPVNWLPHLKSASYIQFAHYGQICTLRYFRLSVSHIGHVIVEGVTVAACCLLIIIILDQTILSDHPYGFIL